MTLKNDKNCQLLWQKKKQIPDNDPISRLCTPFRFGQSVRKQF